ncbi:thymidylate synthase [Nocardia sp. NPDC004085]|uniref:thymidylate synthase n=1 Tax=Nocardia sp. NPDC019302 TaxID=3154592 RepID=UPI0033E03F89
MPTTVGQAVTDALARLLEGGQLVQTSGGKAWRELLGFSTGMSRPRCRIFIPATGSFDLIGAVSRFVWMMRGDEATSTIAYYVPPAANYSPDGLTLPGSNYGHRLRRSLPGVDQIDGVIARLRESPQTRQAGTVIWNPMDAVREAIDVPCAMGTLYHARVDGLIATTMMRSNKPLTLMPFNFFEFSMLGEMIAAETGTPFDSYRHWIAAMQLPEPDVARAGALLGGESYSVEMPVMPTDPAPLQQVRQLCLAEEQVRTASSLSEMMTCLARAEDLLHPYWMALLGVLSVRWLDRHGEHQHAQRVLSGLPNHFGDPLTVARARRLLADAGKAGR